jgi:hypothetical protein
MGRLALPIWALAPAYLEIARAARAGGDHRRANYVENRIGFWYTTGAAAAGKGE